jgi:hypothetical protein
VRVPGIAARVVLCFGTYPQRWPHCFREERLRENERVLRRRALGSTGTTPVPRGITDRGLKRTRSLVQVHAGGSQQVYGCRTDLPDEHAGRQVVAFLQHIRGLFGGLEGEPVRLAAGLLRLLEIPGQVVYRPGEV